jgi:hypothetical protein
VNKSSSILTLPIRVLNVSVSERTELCEGGIRMMMDDGEQVISKLQTWGYRLIWGIERTWESLQETEPSGSESR